MHRLIVAGVLSFIGGLVITFGALFGYIASPSFALFTAMVMGILVTSFGYALIIAYVYEKQKDHHSHQGSFAR